MKKHAPNEKDDKEDMKPEYDFGKMKGGVRGKFCKAYRSGNIVEVKKEMENVKKPTIYIETSVIGHYCACQTRDIIVLARQQITADWWKNLEQLFEPVISPTGLDEISRGDKESAKIRLESVKGFSLLKPTKEVDDLTDFLYQEMNLPEKAKADASHIAFPTIYGIDFIATWNCKHIANAFVIKRLEKILNSRGWKLPFISTPDELMGEMNDDR